MSRRINRTENRGRKVTHYITNADHQKFKAVSEHRDIAMSELLRDWIRDAYKQCNLEEMEEQV